jgi:predicted deoxyguanosinetriphosphate triphosphohydrolase
LSYLITRANIESNKAFQRLLDKTQVLATKLGRQEIVKNRLTHSYEVATSSEIIAQTISTHAFNADYQHSVYNVSLLHDIGHPPFGHDGAKRLSNVCKDLGVEEGFSDNNNNFVVIKKNQIEVSDYELASLIKYPTKLYKSQKSYREILEKAIDEDIAYFGDKIAIDKRPKRTVSCEIMDEADRNTYTCADLADCYCLGLADERELVDMLNSDKFYNVEIIELLTVAIQAVKKRNKTLIKNTFNKLKIRLNQNYTLAKNLKLKHRDKQLFEFREALNKLCMRIYIRSDYVKQNRDIERKYIDFYIDYVLNNEDYASQYYSRKIKEAKKDVEKYTLIRDMIADSTDNFIKAFYEDKHNCIEQ